MKLSESTHSVEENKRDYYLEQFHKQIAADTCVIPEKGEGKTVIKERDFFHSGDSASTVPDRGTATVAAYPPPYMPVVFL